MSINIFQSETFESIGDGATLKFTRTESPEPYSEQLGNVRIAVEQDGSDLRALIDEVVRKTFPSFGNI